MLARSHARARTPPHWPPALQDQTGCPSTGPLRSGCRSCGACCGRTTRASHRSMRPARRVRGDVLRIARSKPASCLCLLCMHACTHACTSTCARADAARTHLHRRARTCACARAARPIAPRGAPPAVRHPPQAGQVQRHSQPARGLHRARWGAGRRVHGQRAVAGGAVLQQAWPAACTSPNPCHGPLARSLCCCTARSQHARCPPTCAAGTRARTCIVILTSLQQQQQAQARAAQGPGQQAQPIPVAPVLGQCMAQWQGTCEHVLWVECGEWACTSVLVNV